MDVIRCDEPQYLIWKWRPVGASDSSLRMNSIRYGSNLRVKDGEVAVFVYKSGSGSIQDFIPGPHDQTIRTANFPVLASIVGLAFDGASPFQAEVYFINLSGNVQIKFGIPYFDVYDPRYMDLGVPCAVRGSLMFNITDAPSFIKLNRLVNFDLDEFKDQIKAFFTRKVKSVVLNIARESSIPVMQLETKIDEISEMVRAKLMPELQSDFGVNLKRFDIGAIEMDKGHPNYQQLKGATADQQTKFSAAKTDIEIDNLSELTRIQRKDVELGVESKNFAAHQLDQQAEVLKAAAQSLGATGSEAGGIAGGGLNPVGLMMGMGIGGAMGGQIGGMMNSMSNTPPLAPSAIYHVAINGKQSGPFSIDQLKQIAQTDDFTNNHHVWKAGMQGWELAGNIPELAEIFTLSPPPPPIPS